MFLVKAHQAQDNIVELSRVETEPIGIEIIGTSGGDRFGDVVLRKNIVRQVPDTAHSLRDGVRGVKITQSTRLIAENNLINDAADRETPTIIKPMVKFFNNRDDTGKLLRGYNTRLKSCWSWKNRSRMCCFRYRMKRIFQLCFALLSLIGAPSGHAADELMSARIDAIQKASNGVHISFTVSDAPDFVDLEGSPTVTGIYREEQDVKIVPVSPGVMNAFVPISTDDRFFRIRLLSGDVTNTLILPIEAQNSFGGGWIPGFDRTPFQQIYAASEFSNAPTDVIEINGMAWRLDEEASKLDTTVTRLTIIMGVYLEAMSELPGRGFIPTDFDATVFDHQNVRLTAAAGRPATAFDIRIQFDTPYRYDRNLGQLVMQIEDTLESDGRAFDAARVSAERGWLYRDDFPNSPYSTPSMIVTEFSYTTIRNQ